MSFRRTIRLVALAALLSALFVTHAQARTAPDDTAEATSSSEVATKVLNNVRSLLGGELGGVLGALPLPEELTEAAAPAGDLTMALRDLALVKDELSGKDRAQAEAFLARPSDPPGPNNPDTAYSVPEETPACQGGVCVHYVASGNDAPALADNDANGRPDYIDTALLTTIKVRNTYIAAGYRAPKGDGALGGGSNQSDIYIADIGDDGLYGYCSTDQNIPSAGPYDAWAYCVLDDDYAASEFPTNTPIENLQVTIAHEYFHAVQFAYDIAEDSWFMEATAAWVEDELYPAVDDNFQYLRESPLRLPRISMDSFGGSFHYGTWIFFRYLSERYTTEQGGLPTIVRDMIRKTDGSAGKPDLYSMQAVKSVLNARGADLPKLFATFAAANRRPAQTYREGKALKYPTAPLVKTLRLGRGQSKGDTLNTDHLTSATVRLKPSKSVSKPNAKVRIFVDMAPTNRGSAAVITVKLKSGKARMISVKLKGNGAGTKTLPFSAKKVSYLELTLANAGTNYSCFNGGPYSCQGTSKNDGVKETYRATVLGR